MSYRLSSYRYIQVFMYISIKIRLARLSCTGSWSVPVFGQGSGFSRVMLVLIFFSCIHVCVRCIIYIFHTRCMIYVCTITVWDSFRRSPALRPRVAFTGNGSLYFFCPLKFYFFKYILKIKFFEIQYTQYCS